MARAAISMDEAPSARTRIVLGIRFFMFSPYEQRNAASRKK
jgi:hypothetical protein